VESNYLTGVGGGWRTLCSGPADDRVMWSSFWNRPDTGRPSFWNRPESGRDLDRWPSLWCRPPQTRLPSEARGDMQLVDWLRLSFPIVVVDVWLPGRVVLAGDVTHGTELASVLVVNCTLHITQYKVSLSAFALHYYDGVTCVACTTCMDVLWMLMLQVQMQLSK